MLATEHVLAVADPYQALVDVHGAARLVLHRLGQDGGVHAVAQRRFAHGALEQEHLVGQVHRVGVACRRPASSRRSSRTSGRGSGRTR
ncbi:hypothetical protein G6F50_017675 [Rhizopus delemar]|uniref:Uncharacterized protein n=1 Tax=Rhizopus delemar TaxID=936053 RepID=A0A9P6XPC6_9FUNG|nr:hypothetical protein G6F50_017675 [Rhizopus delemar]